MSRLHASLAAFPRPNAPNPGFGVDVTLRVPSAGAPEEIEITFQVVGDATSLRLPSAVPDRSPIRAHDLWKDTCWEAFFGAAGEPGYWELNVSPWGDWNFYRFDAYRSGMREEAAPPLVRLNRPGPGIFRVTLSGPWVPARLREEMEISLTAVSRTFEAQTGTDATTYWALRHPGAQPDFHLRASFAARWAPNARTLTLAQG